MKNIILAGLILLFMVGCANATPAPLLVSNCIAPNPKVVGTGGVVEIAATLVNTTTNLNLFWFNVTCEVGAVGLANKTVVAAIGGNNASYTIPNTLWGRCNVTCAANMTDGVSNFSLTQNAFNVTNFYNYTLISSKLSENAGMNYASYNQVNLSVTVPAESSYGRTVCTVGSISLLNTSVFDSISEEMMANTTVGAYGDLDVCGTALAVTCTNAKGISNTSTLTFSQFPCLRANTSVSSDISATGDNTLVVNFGTNVNSLKSVMNAYVNYTGDRTNCSITAILNGQDINFTAEMAKVTYNTTHVYCPYGLTKINDTTVIVQKIAGLTGGSNVPAAGFGSYAVGILVFVGGAAAGIGSTIFVQNRRRTLKPPAT